MAVTAENPAPYAPASAIIEIISRYRNRGLATPITGDVLGRAGVSDSLIPRTMQALQTLELVGPDGAPTETLEGLRRAKEADFQPQMAAWLQSVYADVFAFVNPADDEVHIRDAFRTYQPIGQQPRMVSLFTALCRAAGLRSGEQTKESRSRPAARKSSVSTTVARREKQPPARQQQNPAIAGGSGGLPPVIAGLLTTLPIESGEWTKAERAKFLKAFEAMLDYSFEVLERPLNASAQDDDDSLA